MQEFQLSFWERQSHFAGIDLLVIGGGIVGLNAALQAKMAEPGLKVTVVDRGPFLPYGASTRNAGFACFGSMTELLDDLQKTDEQHVFTLVQKRWEGLMRLRSLLGDAALCYEPFGGYELFTSAEEEFFGECISRMEQFNRHLQSITGQAAVYSDASALIPAFGFKQVHHLILNKGEGQLDTGRMMQALTDKARRLGIEVLTGMPVTRVEPEDKGVRVMTAFGFDFSTAKVLVTTNAFARQLLPELEVEPGRAQVLITGPVAGLPFRGSFHYDKGYYYFRNVGDRVLFGGGRNLNFEAEATTEFGTTSLVQQRLEQLLSDVILPGIPYEVDQRWSGIMGLGPVKSAIVKKVMPGVYCAVRMGGMGVAIGSLIGEEVAQLILSE